MSIQAIVRKSNTIALTFSSKPEVTLIQKLKAAGFKYENGNWYKGQSESKLISEPEIEFQLEA